MLKRAQLDVQPVGSSWRAGIILLLIISVLPLGLAWISSGFTGLQGWPSFLGAVTAATGLLWIVFRLLRVENPPRGLAWLLAGAVLLRLALGALWFVVLPVGGYQSPAEQGGYVMADAAERDRTAWELGKSGQSLLRAFQGFRKADQYGGLLFLSALVYHLLGGNTHQPLLMIVITAAFSALAIPFTWAAARRAWGARAAWLAAWGLALYPEAVLLGSSQMREAFLVTLAAAAFYGLMRYEQQRSRAGLAWIAAAILMSLPFSPPVAALLMVLLLIQLLLLRRGLQARRLLRRQWLWLIAAGLALAALAGMWLSWRQFAPVGVDHPVALLSWWLQKSADWQAHLSERASGWIQKIFDETPDWMNLPLLLAYGVARPFLPAALIDITSVPVWYGIAVWRALGWTLLLPLLVYAPLRAFRRDGTPLARGLSVAVWLVILLASFRAGGDEWDNVRYRSAFAAIQIALAAWVVAGPRPAADAWLRRVVVGVAFVLAWFIPWYLRRYLHLPWPVGSFYLTLGLGLASAVLYALVDGYRARK